MNNQGFWRFFPCTCDCANIIHGESLWSPTPSWERVISLWLAGVNPICNFPKGALIHMLESGNSRGLCLFHFWECHKDMASRPGRIQSGWDRGLHIAALNSWWCSLSSEPRRAVEQDRGHRSASMQNLAELSSQAQFAAPFSTHPEGNSREREEVQKDNLNDYRERSDALQGEFKMLRRAHK